MIGLGVGINYAPRTRIIAVFDTNAGPQGDGTFALSPFLSIACATTNRTSQTSATTVQKSFAANAARGRNVGNGWGLSVESTSTNRDKNSEAVDQWSLTGSATATNTNGHAAPDGTSTADKLNWTGGADSLGSAVLSAVPNGTRGCASVWVLQDGVTTQIQSYDSNATVWNDTFTITAAWQRISSQGASNPNSINRWGRHGVIAAGAAWLWGDQLEDHGYPTSYIVSAAGAVARAADVLSSTASIVAPGGFFDVAMTIAPNYAQTEFSADHDLFFLDSNNRTFLRQADKKIVQRIGGADIVSAALTFARDTALIVRTRHARTERRLSVNGVDVTGAATTAISLPSTAYWLGNASGSQECADLRRLSVFHP